jgi:hypothetical protein
MDHIFNKENIEDSNEEGSASSTYNAFGSRNQATFSTSILRSSSSNPTVSLPPTQRVLPSTLSTRSGVASGVAGGYKYSRPNENKHFHNESNSSFNPHGPITADPNTKELNPPYHHPHCYQTGHPQNPHLDTGSAMAQDGGVSQEDEWKNIKVVRLSSNSFRSLIFHFRC